MVNPLRGLVWVARTVWNGFGTITGRDVEMGHDPDYNDTPKGNASGNIGGIGGGVGW